jgi:hypothetical protein
VFNGSVESSTSTNPAPWIEMSTTRQRSHNCVPLARYRALHSTGSRSVNGRAGETLPGVVRLDASLAPAASVTSQCSASHLFEWCLCVQLHRGQGVPEGPLPTSRATPTCAARAQRACPITPDQRAAASFCARACAYTDAQPDADGVNRSVGPGRVIVLDCTQWRVASLS